jgi:hypothetical protein
MARTPIIALRLTAVQTASYYAASPKETDITTSEPVRSTANESSSESDWLQAGGGGEEEEELRRSAG